MSDTLMDDIARSKTEHLYQMVFKDIHELVKLVEALKLSLPNAAEGFQSQLKPALREFEVTLGLIVDKGKLSNESLLKAANALRTETVQIIEAAKNAALESATYTADIQGKHAVKGIEAKAKEAKISIEDFADGLKKDIAENTEILTYKALEQPLENLAIKTNAALKSLGDATTALGAAKKQLEEANTAIKKSLLESCAWILGAVVLGSVLTLGSAYAFGWIGHNNGFTKDDYNTIINNQRAIYEKIEALKPTAKNAVGK